jgi:hypothetical protein
MLNITAPGCADARSFKPKLFRGQACPRNSIAHVALPLRELGFSISRHGVPFPLLRFAPQGFAIALTVS